MDVRQQGILSALTADTEIHAIEPVEIRALQPFAISTLIVINGRQIAVCGDIIHEELQHFSASLDTTVEFRIRFRKRSRFQIGAT
jgi:hypothetical protein